MNNQQEAIPETPTTKSKLPLIIGVIVFLAILIIGINYFGKTTSKTEIQTVVPTKPVITAVVDETASWKTYISLGNTYTMKYPSDFVESNLMTYEGGGTDKYITDTKATADKFKGQNPGDQANLSSDSILISPNIAVNTSILKSTNPAGHTEEELLQKLVNSEFGGVRYTNIGETVPWPNLGDGKTFDGKGTAYDTVPFTKTSVDGHLAAKLTNKNAVFYIILNGKSGSKSIGLVAQPSNSKYIDIFDQIVNTLKISK